MARVKFKIDPEKTYEIIKYFDNGINEFRCLTYLKGGQAQAQKELTLFFDRYFHASVSGRAKVNTEVAEELKIWLEKYVSDKDWTNCLGAIRQKSFCKLKSMKAIKFPAQEYYAIDYYAKEVGLPVWKAIFQLVEKEKALLRQAGD